MATSPLPPPPDLKTIKLTELKQVAKSVSVDTKGTKTDLILRLEKCSGDIILRAYNTISSNPIPPASDAPSVLCPVCDKKFTHKPGEEYIQCESVCQTWYHRCCAGLSKPLSNKLSQSPTPFCCLTCRVAKTGKEIALLKEQV
uniref:PHD-type domain-containing protein n=1 Tax=Amphimedon queenslandica TaxID=400682 RepID=A0A1X7VJG2_AMPQE